MQSLSKICIYENVNPLGLKGTNSQEPARHTTTTTNSLRKVCTLYSLNLSNFGKGVLWAVE